MNEKRFIMGFTLIELLISLAIAGIILGSLYSTFFLVQRITEFDSNFIVKVEEGRNVLTGIRIELESLYLRSGDERTYFVLKDRDYYGRSASTVSFTTMSGGSGIQRVSYYVDEVNNMPFLIKEGYPAFKEGSMKAEVLEDIEGFLIVAVDQGKEFRTWDSKIIGRVPEIVRVELALRIGERIVRLSQFVKMKKQ